MSEFEPRFPNPENDPQLPEETSETKEKDKKKSRKKPSFSADYSREDSLEKARLDREPQAKKAGEALLGALSKEAEASKLPQDLHEADQVQHQQTEESTESVSPEAPVEDSDQDIQEVETEIEEPAQEDSGETEMVDSAIEAPQYDVTGEVEDDEEEPSTTRQSPTTPPPVPPHPTPPTSPNRIPPIPPVPPVSPPIHRSPSTPPPPPGQPTFNRPSQAPNIQPNPLTNQNILTTQGPDAEAYGFRKGRRQGLVVGGLVAWAGTRWNQGRKRDKMEKKHKREISELKKKVSNLETEKPVQPVASTRVRERFEHTKESVTSDKEPVIGSAIKPGIEKQPVVTAHEKSRIITEDHRANRESTPIKSSAASVESEIKRTQTLEDVRGDEKMFASPENATEIVNDRKEIKQEPNDAGLQGGGAASQSTGANTPVAPSIHAVSTLQPMASHVTNVRSQAAKSAKRAQVAARIEIAAAVILGMVFAAWLFLR